MHDESIPPSLPTLPMIILPARTRTVFGGPGEAEQVIVEGSRLTSWLILLLGPYPIQIKYTQGYG